MLNKYALLLPITLLLSCSTLSETGSNYEQEIHDWQQGRNERLNQPDGWLTLAGLFWLEQGSNSFGSAESNDLVFSSDELPPVMGVFVLEGDSVTLDVTDGVEILIRDSLVTEQGIRKDISGSPDVMHWNEFSWYIIQRGDRIGVRLKNARHPNYLNFKPTEYFPVSQKWRIPASLVPADSGASLEIINVLGDLSQNPTPGALEFQIAGKPYSLTAWADPEDSQYFLIFGDATNGISTYGAGRYLVVPAADSTGQTMIDFNKTYNMPCVYSPYATCPLPPLENVLDVAIEAGEQSYPLEWDH